jgi:hypothetical protein
MFLFSFLFLSFGVLLELRLASNLVCYVAEAGLELFFFFW